MQLWVCNESLGIKRCLGYGTTVPLARLCEVVSADPATVRRVFSDGTTTRRGEDFLKLEGEFTAASLRRCIAEPWQVSSICAVQ
jgi:hypothetical protein